MGAYRWIGLFAVILGANVAHAEVSCFRTPSEAALQVGEQELGGYRLEFVHRDAFGGRAWARVRSCSHPEWPAVLVAGVVPVAAHPLQLRVVQVGSKPLDVVGGRRVKVLQLDSMAQIEMAGVAQESGWVGDSVWVKILYPGDTTGGRFARGTVRGNALLEVEP